MASVTGMIKHLAAEGYLRHKPYYGVKLTEKGRKVALDMLRRHRVIELFLVRTLGLSWDEVKARVRSRYGRGRFALLHRLWSPTFLEWCLHRRIRGAGRRK